MTDDNDASLAQAAVFCVELHRHIELLDRRASSQARRLRTHKGQQGALRRPDVIAAIQKELTELAVARRGLLEMLAAMGHGYPCGHAGSDQLVQD